MEKCQYLQQVVPRKLDTGENIKLRSYTVHKNKLKGIKHLNVQPTP